MASDSPNIRTIRIVIVGFGNMGRNLARLLLVKEKYVQSKYSINIIVTGIVDLEYVIVDESGLGLNLEEILSLKKAELVNRSSNLSYDEILQDIPSDIIIELTTSTPDGEPGITHIQKAFQHQKHVVTTNKSPLVLKLSPLKMMIFQKEKKY